MDCHGGIYFPELYLPTKYVGGACCFMFYFYMLALVYLGITSCPSLSGISEVVFHLFVPTTQGNLVLLILCIGREISEAIPLLLLMTSFAFGKDWPRFLYPSLPVLYPLLSLRHITSLLSGFCFFSHLTT